MAGYHVVFWALRSQAKSDLLHRLDADRYSSEETIVLTIPVSLPYPIHEAEYERANAEIEYNGEYYQLVKQKVENGTLFMVCVKDHQQKRLDRTMNEYTNLANDLPSSAKHAMDLMGKLFKDFAGTSFDTPSMGLVLKYDILFAVGDFLIIKEVYPIDSPPPELA